MMDAAPAVMAPVRVSMTFNTLMDPEVYWNGIDRRMVRVGAGVCVNSKAFDEDTGGVFGERMYVEGDDDEDEDEDVCVCGAK